MCLIAVAHRASQLYPLVVAANRDELYDRPTLAAHWWSDAPDVVGGRDVEHGGSWLAMTRSGRLAAVTNLRGERRPDARSRGLLVGDFVRSAVAPDAYAREVAEHEHEYSGFHLIAGVAGGTFAHVQNGARLWPHGIHAVSNGPREARWLKMELAIARMTSALQSNDVIAELLDFLATSRGAARLDEEIFVETERYGTRSSTVIVATEEAVTFVERSWPGGREVRFDFALVRSV